MAVTEIRVLVVDDEPLARRGIRQLLARHRDMVVVGECRDAREALRALETLAPDLVFLDVQMPGLDGFGLIRTHGMHRMPAVVFVTAFDEFAVRAFEADAVDYLVKPLAQGRFEATLARVRGRLRAAGVRETVLVPTPTGSLLLDAAEIGWIEARDYYACVHAGGKRYLVRESLRALERTLNPAHFFRVHRGAIVRLDQVRELRAPSDGEAAAILRDGTSVPVSRRRRERLKALLQPARR
jgi:two-component system, LytTR family, response regulator